MDLEISGRKAIVCASSQGLGASPAHSALAREGVEVVINGRDAQKLEHARDTPSCRRDPALWCDSLRRTSLTESGREALVGACPEADILINNNGGPPPGQLEDWDREAWLQALEANMIAPILLIRALVPGMRARRFGRIVNITSAMVKSPRYAMTLSTAARTGLTAACKAISREVARDNVTINNLLPERIDTPRQAFMTERMMKEQSITREAARAQIAASVAAKRFGTPEEFGAACAFSVRRAGRIHFRAEFAARWRLLPGADLMAVRSFSRTTVVGSYPQPDWLVEKNRCCVGSSCRESKQGSCGVSIPRCARRRFAMRRRSRSRTWRTPGLTSSPMERSAGRATRTTFGTHWQAWIAMNPPSILNRAGREVRVLRVVGPIRHQAPVELDVGAIPARADPPPCQGHACPGHSRSPSKSRTSTMAIAETLALEFAAALNVEARLLQEAGIDVIQFDEPWLRNDPEAARASVCGP